jgi:hypothetical protein
VGRDRPVRDTLGDHLPKLAHLFFGQTMRRPGCSHWHGDGGERVHSGLEPTPQRFRVHPSLLGELRQCLGFRANPHDAVGAR